MFFRYNATNHMILIWTNNNKEREKSTLHRPVLEETQSLMGPDPDKSIKVKCLHRSDGFTDASHPASHLTRTVYVVWLHVLGEALLNRQRITKQ